MLTILVTVVAIVFWFLGYQIGRMIAIDDYNEQIFWIQYKNEEQVQKLKDEKKAVEFGMEPMIQERVRQLMYGIQNSDMNAQECDATEAK